MAEGLWARARFVRFGGRRRGGRGNGGSRWRSSWSCGRPRRSRTRTTASRRARCGGRGRGWSSSRPRSASRWPSSRTSRLTGANLKKSPDRSSGKAPYQIPPGSQTVFQGGSGHATLVVERDTLN